MGFDRPAVLAALQSNGNSVEAAANMLLRWRKYCDEEPYLKCDKIDVCRTVEQIFMIFGISIMWSK